MPPAGMNLAASAFPVACRGVSERMGNIIIPYGSKILCSLLRRASIGGQRNCCLQVSSAAHQGDMAEGEEATPSATRREEIEKW